jgi:hypothetical protein
LRGRRPVSRAGDENRSGGCKPPSLEFVSVVAVNGSTEFVEADYETRSDCHRVACDGWPSITGIRSWCPASLGPRFESPRSGSGRGEELAKKQTEMKFSTQYTVRVLAGVILLISLGGCGAIDLDATKIGDYKQFKVPNVDTFLILDDINAQKIKITTSTSAKASAFMNNIFTFGLRFPDAPEGTMKGAAIDYLKSTNRNCTIVSDKEVERMGWEFQYHCEAKTEQEGKKS